MASRAPSAASCATRTSGSARQPGAWTEIAASVEDLNAWSAQPRTVVILENKETSYAITDDHPCTTVLHGHGFSVVNYARITWARHARSLKLASYEPAVTPSPSCAGLIRDQYPVLGVSGGVPVYELLEFLVAVLGVVDCAALTPASSRSGTP